MWIYTSITKKKKKTAPRTSEAPLHLCDPDLFQSLLPSPRPPLLLPLLYPSQHKKPWWPFCPSLSLAHSHPTFRMLSPPESIKARTPSWVLLGCLKEWRGLTISLLMVSNHELVMFCVLTNTYSQLQGKSPFVAQPYTVAYNKSYFASILTFFLFHILLCIIMKSHVIKPTAMFFLCESICLFY